MGRGVSTLTGAIIELYVNYDEEYNYDGEREYDDFDWEDFLERVKLALKKIAPSLNDADDWEDEDHIILQNGTAKFAVAEYCGIVSISAAPLQDDYYEYVEIFGASWLTRIEASVERALVAEFGENVYGLSGRFSSGESVYHSLKPKVVSKGAGK